MKSSFSFPNRGISRGHVLMFVFADALAIAFAMLVAVLLRLGWRNGCEYLDTHQVAILIAWGVFLIALGIGGLYESDQLYRLGRTLVAAIVAVALGTLFVTAIFYAMSSSSWHIGRGIFLVFSV